MIKAVIFDLNGIFVMGEYFSSRIEALYGVPADDFYKVLKKVMARVRKKNVKDSFRLWKPHLKHFKIPLNREAFFNLWFSGEYLNSEAINYSKKLKSLGIKVFILSNNFKERVEYYRQHFPELFKSTNKVYFSCETGYVKPDPQAYKQILRENGLKPQECLYLDDSEQNVLAARKLGIHAQKFQGLKEARKYIESFFDSLLNE